VSDYGRFTNIIKPALQAPFDDRDDAFVVGTDVDIVRQADRKFMQYAILNAKLMDPVYSTGTNNSVDYVDPYAFGPLATGGPDYGFGWLISTEVNDDDGSLIENYLDIVYSDIDYHPYYVTIYLYSSHDIEYIDAVGVSVSPEGKWPVIGITDSLDTLVVVGTGSYYKFKVSDVALGSGTSGGVNNVASPIGIYGVSSTELYIFVIDSDGVLHVYNQDGSEQVSHDISASGELILSVGAGGDVLLAAGGDDYTLSKYLLASEAWDTVHDAPDLPFSTDSLTYDVVDGVFVAASGGDIAYKVGVADAWSSVVAVRGDDLSAYPFVGVSGGIVAYDGGHYAFVDYDLGAAGPMKIMRSSFDYTYYSAVPTPAGMVRWKTEKVQVPYPVNGIL